MLRGAASSGRRCGPAPGAPVSKPPTQTLRPRLHVDQDEIYSVTLGPTLAQILEKHAQGTLIGRRCRRLSRRREGVGRDA